MPDKYTPSHSYQDRTADDLVARRLITLERTQKLDLLIHLLANLRRALIVCGPEGIGKTTLLQTLEISRKSQWRIFRISGTANLSFETIIIELSRFLKVGNSGHGFDLSSIRNYCNKQKVVLIIDDAGELVPGLITELMDLSESISGLRLVFSMTYEQYQLKNVAEKALDDCHFIELPPLTSRQCTEYLQNLSAQPGAILSFNAITDQLVTALYAETQGIPGKILAEIPKLNEYQNRQRNRNGLWLVMAVIILIGTWVIKSQLPQMADMAELGKHLIEKIEPVTVSTEPVAVNIPSSEPVVTEAVVEKSPVPDQTTPLPKIPEATNSKDSTPPADDPVTLKTTSDAISNPGELKPVPLEINETADLDMAQFQAPVSKTPNPPAITVQTAKPAMEAKPEKSSPANENPEWIMTQPPGNFTLQVMVLSNKAAASRFIKKYPQFADGLTYYPINNGFQEKYVLIYGSFNTEIEAREYKAKLPQEFRQALEKRFRSIQNESRR